MNYLVESPKPRYVPFEPNSAIIARYARGRDYHKVMRGRLKTLATRIREKVGDFESRPFADSAPIFEKSLAESAGMGWTGKHTLLIHKKSGSFFVLGELFTSLDLPFDEPATAHCGSCTACIDICPTQAIVEPYMLDARRCIAYLTIEYKGIIAEELRAGIGNRIFGCDDCQLICPWNSFAKMASIPDFNPRHGLDDIRLLDIWQWDEATFLAHTEGSPIRRTGYPSFKRNIAIGLGNAPYSAVIVAKLQDAKTCMMRWSMYILIGQLSSNLINQIQISRKMMFFALWLWHDFCMIHLNECNAIIMDITMTLRNDWTREEIQALYEQPFLDLVLQAHSSSSSSTSRQCIQVSTLFQLKRVNALKIASIAHNLHITTPNLKLKNVLQWIK